MTTAAQTKSLPELRRLFAGEVKRNLFEAYLRPKQTVIKLVSNSISSSSSPGGEGTSFSASPRGHHLLAYNSSRIYVMDLRGAQLEVKRELKILRRPAATCIKDDGSLLAVLLTEMQIDIYDLTQSPPRRTQSIILDHSPHAIALSPCGSVLAAAYDGGIEVSFLSPGALPTDRRAVKCDGVDALAFSFDGRQILGTTVHSSPPNTVILTAPYYDPGSHMVDENISTLWTTSILFPNSSRDCSHAVLLQHTSREEASWTFTYDRSFETFRAVRIDDLRNGTTHFTGPIPGAETQGRLLPSTLPTASYTGDLVAAGFQGKEIWIYGVPQDLDAVADSCHAALAENISTANGLCRFNSTPRPTSRIQDAAGEARVPQWQLLCDKLRNTFVGGYRVAELDGVSTVKWVAGSEEDSPLRERLVLAARGVLPAKPITEEDGIDFVDGGRITILDFDYGVSDGETTEVTIEVGTKEPEVLEEETRDMDTEVAIVRRRTVAQKRRSRGPVMRVATTASRPPTMPEPKGPRPEELEDPLLPRRMGAPPRPEPPAQSEEEAETESIIEAQEALDAPYAHASPRSGTTLRRAATAAANSRRLNPQPAAAGPVQYRRADGRTEHPHESDADNWVPPPPPYQENPQDLPVFLRHQVQPTPGPDIDVQPQSPAARAAVTMRQSSYPQNTPPAAMHRRSISDSSAVLVHPGEAPTPARHPLADVANSEDNLYDVSPPRSPQMDIAVPRVRTGSMSTESSGFVTIPDTPTPTTSMRQAPIVPCIQTTAASSSSSPLTPSSARSHPPILGLHIPSPTTAQHLPSIPPTVAVSTAVRRLSASQTWPTQPPLARAPAVVPVVYRHSAPPMNLTADEAIARSYASPPRPEQFVGAGPSTYGQQAPPSRQSGSFQVPRAPVGSHDGRQFSDQQAQYHHFPHPHPHRPAPPPPDPPLIISTPKGVSGGFDAPTPKRSPSTGQAEQPIFAPVPRRNRDATTGPHRSETVERFETFYNGPPHPPVQQPMGMGIPGPSTALFPAGPIPSGGAVLRQSSLFRRQSRAERSAAKNMADAKRHGWTRRRSKNKREKKGSSSQRPDLDSASNAAWTDVTVHSASAGYGGPGTAAGQRSSRWGNKKCVVM